MSVRVEEPEPSMQLTLTVRDVQPEDLGDLDWSGGPEHLAAMAEALQASYAGDVILLVVALDNGRLVASGAADLRKHEGAGTVEMLAVHETFQSLGLGSWLVRALEDRIRSAGVSTVRLAVENDNPDAAALYRRLGYREVGTTLDSWPTAAGTYVTVSAVMQRDLQPTDH